MRHTFHSERALTEQLNTCETSLKTIFRAYNDLDSQLSRAGGHAPKVSEVDNIRFAESVYRSFNVSTTILEGEGTSGLTRGPRQTELNIGLRRLQIMLDDNKAATRSRVLGKVGLVTLRGCFSGG